MRAHFLARVAHRSLGQGRRRPRTAEAASLMQLKSPPTSTAPLFSHRRASEHRSQRTGSRRGTWLLGQLPGPCRWKEDEEPDRGAPLGDLSTACKECTERQGGAVRWGAGNSPRMAGPVLSGAGPCGDQGQGRWGREAGRGGGHAGGQDPEGAAQGCLQVLSSYRIGPESGPWREE